MTSVYVLNAGILMMYAYMHVHKAGLLRHLYMCLKQCSHGTCICEQSKFTYECIYTCAQSSVGKELNKLLCFRSNPIVVLLYVLYM